MLKVIEAFSGIGSQVKALKNIQVDYEIIGTIDWDINAIIAYDIIHHGEIDLTLVEEYSINEIKEKLKEYTLSSNGKEPMTKEQIKRLRPNVAKNLLAAIIRSKNLVSIVDVKGEELPNKIDVLTYSFPCQDLSIARAWHGENGGIERGAGNRSGMLWEIERILEERISAKMELPQFLLMENVSNIMGPAHRENFNEWQANLEKMGYYNKVYKLNAENFGIPQKRNRVYMISVLTKNLNINRLQNYLMNNNLEKTIFEKKVGLEEILKINYEYEKYRKEANRSIPNDTPSRQKIYNGNTLLYDEKKFFDGAVGTLTTKQDRHPNSGIVSYVNEYVGKSNFRYLTPRECFLLMGFEEEDYDRLMKNNFENGMGKVFFTDTKLYKMAGNSIVVNVLEAIFQQIEYIRINYLLS